jgi:uncharacterized protein (TIGR02246 family)
MADAGRTEQGNELQIRKLIDDWAKALHAKDVDKIMSVYASDVVAFDLAPPLKYAGADAHRESFEQWFATFRGPIASEMRDLDITVGKDVAFSRCFNRIRGARTNGEETDVWVRVTVCFHKRDDKWMVVHEHVSVPFYMDGSYRAAVDLEP